MRDEGRTRERLVGVALLGAILLNFPVVHLFSNKGTFLGVPLLVAYLFIVWAGLIVLVALVIRSPRRERTARGELDEP